jgi:copper chaperone CopZ
MKIVWALLLVACSRHDDPIASKPAVVHAAPVAAEAAVARAKPDKLQHVTIKALGMTCEESCPMRVRYALADMPAVYELGFDLDHEAIFVSYDAALGTPKEVTRPMIAAISRAGFDPWLAREDWPADAKVQVVTR